MKLLASLMCLTLLPLTSSFAIDSATSSSCKSVSGSEKVLRPGAVLMLGELHGTDRAPAIVADLVCAALDSGLSVTVALEVLDSEQARCDEFMQSDGTASDFAKLLQGDFWHRDMQDGRSSHAMAQLIESLRSLGADLESDSSGRLSLLMIDNVSNPKGRDHHMAMQLKAQIEKSPERCLISLTGNWHNQIIRGSSFDDEFESMGYLLKQWKPEVNIVALDMIHNGGSAWVCRGGGVCDSLRQGSIADGEGIKLYDANAHEQYSGYYYVGKISASPPAINDN